jgi:hypothetical protein
MTKETAALIAKALALRDALDTMLRLWGRTGNSLEDFEDVARWFYQETGFLRPGKDVPAALGGSDRGDDEKRQLLYQEWYKAKVKAAQKVLAEAGDRCSLQQDHDTKLKEISKDIQSIANMASAESPIGSLARSVLNKLTRI